MMYCEKCKIDIFGGSICHVCGSKLVDKTEENEPKAAKVTSELIMGKRKRLKSELAQSLAGRIFRLVLEMVLFCAIFVGLTYGLIRILNWLSTEMSEDPEEAIGLIDLSSAALRYFWYVGCVVVVILTYKFRFKGAR